MGERDEGPHPLVARAQGGEALRVWSVIVTIFGDVVAPRGGEATGAMLGELTGLLGIGPGALRVALHRLVRDGWLERSRAGRASRYALSARGMEAFGPARARIYAEGPGGGEGLTLWLAEPGMKGAERAVIERKMSASGAALIGPGLWLSERQGIDAPEALLGFTGEAARLPGWLRARLGPPELAAAYRRLDADMQALDARLDRAGPDPALAAALRALIVHRWRRCLLRHPDLPARFFPDDWPGEAVRARFLSLHRRLSEPADPWLDARFGRRRQPARASK
ncbi:transcriptional regulator, PaaX family [Meinhardsimonia xiamenensis]|jgi:phenylacetic acid degradation operon negative regulatory protein|uniref:Transcriptional regulator, PaaX family n=1 Tax=Meinhardsimonia xiamenensis TaxID=990712 RepID=A0A1G9FHD5_9RHOB|nr:PaaX family transcriptional regulator C-terminal domain-containing protein [Meinhardsimonia xiamenensis]PRX37847.1 PaaX family transcriptional regulator [Meinhardsimonia xiamenensis]SDK87736.1 transcriptional regulator, PaaX family [Meinhardsimonia xiamenensis]